MAASKTNYICVFKGESQVFGCASKEGALETPPPPGIPLEDKRVLFITYHPDEGTLLVHEVPREEVLEATIKERPVRKKKTDEQDPSSEP